MWKSQIIMDFTVPADHRVKLKESKKRGNYLDLATELKKKKWNMKVTVIPVVTGALVTIPKGLVQKLEKLEIRGDYPDNSIIKIGQNTGKSPGDLR